MFPMCACIKLQTHTAALRTCLTSYFSAPLCWALSVLSLVSWWKVVSVASVLKVLPAAIAFKVGFSYVHGRFSASQSFLQCLHGLAPLLQAHADADDQHLQPGTGLNRPRKSCRPHLFHSAGRDPLPLHGTTTNLVLRDRVPPKCTW